MDKEDSILLAAIEDKLKRCEERGIMSCTQFLDPRQCRLAEEHFKYSRHVFIGGYEDAERRVMVFLPDYLDRVPDDDVPVSLLRVTVRRGGKALTHRDYLGALMALGIERSVAGDIIVCEDGADIVILKSIEDFLLSNYAKAGRSELSCSLLPISELRPGTVRLQERFASVASLRLDGIISAAFCVSRSKAQEAVRGGSVFINGFQCEKPDAEVNEGDRLVLRGKGKAVLRSVGGCTRKGRVSITIELYV